MVEKQLPLWSSNLANLIETILKFYNFSYIILNVMFINKGSNLWRNHDFWIKYDRIGTLHFQIIIEMVDLSLSFSLSFLSLRTRVHLGNIYPLPYTLDKRTWNLWNTKVPSFVMDQTNTSFEINKCVSITLRSKSFHKLYCIQKSSCFSTTTTTKKKLKR